MIECDAHAAAQTKQKTIREMLLQFPEDHFDLMTPGGFVTLTPSDAATVLAGGSVSGHPGIPGFAREVTAEELLDQVICICQHDQGTWHILSDFPEQTPEQSADFGMGGPSM